MPPADVETLAGEKLEAKVDVSLVLGNGSENKFGDASLPSPPVGIDEGNSENSPVESSASFEKVQGHISEINDGENASQGSGSVPELASRSPESSEVDQVEPRWYLKDIILPQRQTSQLSEMKPGRHEAEVGDGKDPSRITEVLPEDASNRNEPLPVRRTEVG
ncbi:hypothetical protein NL676_023475 [Syzygium grande]|nr:hypothetical protein NL676_023475 [Syzygium grande]